MHGSISVRSDPGKGATFTASLSLELANESQLEPVVCSVAIAEGFMADEFQRLFNLVGCDKVMHADNPELVLFDGLGDYPAALSTDRAVAVMPLAATLPDHLLASGIEHRLDYPCTWWRLRQVLRDVRLSDVPESPQPTTFAGTHRILVAEDDEISRMIVTELLESAGLAVTEAADGRQALDCLDQATFDLVLMDIEMPVMGGLDAIREIRSMAAEVAELPVIAMTAHALVGDKERFLAAGMNDYITKPIDPDSLLATIRQWLPQAT